MIFSTPSCRPFGALLLGCLGPFGFSGCAARAGTVDAGTAADARRDMRELPDQAPHADSQAICPPPPTFAAPAAVSIRGYDGEVMEPFVGRDGSALLFNNRNDPGVDTNLHWAVPEGDDFAYRGEVAGTQTPKLEGVPSLGPDSTLYFVSTRSYDTTLSTLYRAAFAAGKASAVELIAGVSRSQPLWVNFDLEISADGQRLYFVDGLHDQSNGQWHQANLVVAAREDNGFRRLDNSETLLAAINSAAWEYAPATSADQTELYFTRYDEQHDPPVPRIWVAVRPDASRPFCAPRELVEIEGFVEGATIASDGAMLFHRKDPDGKYRLYRAPRH